MAIVPGIRPSDSCLLNEKRIASAILFSLQSWAQTVTTPNSTAAASITRLIPQAHSRV